MGPRAIAENPGEEDRYGPRVSILGNPIHGPGANASTDRVPAP